MTAGSCRTCAVRRAERHREPWQSVAVAGEAADVIGSWRRARLAALLTGSGAGACEALVGGWRLDGDRLGEQSQRRAWITGRWRRRPPSQPGAGVAAGLRLCRRPGRDL